MSSTKWGYPRMPHGVVHVLNIQYKRFHCPSCARHQGGRQGPSRTKTACPALRAPAGGGGHGQETVTACQVVSRTGKGVCGQGFCTLGPVQGSPRTGTGDPGREFQAEPSERGWGKGGQRAREEVRETGQGFRHRRDKHGTEHNAWHPVSYDRDHEGVRKVTPGPALSELRPSCVG